MLIERFAGTPPDQQVIFAKFLPGRCTCQGRPLHNIFAVFNTPLPDNLVCVFLSLRGIGRDGFAAILEQNYDTQQDVLNALGLDIHRVPGFLPYISGCQRVNGTYYFEHGDVISLHYALEDLPHPDRLRMDDSSDSESDPDDGSGNDNEIVDVDRQQESASSQTGTLDDGLDAGIEQPQMTREGETGLMWNFAVANGGAFPEGKRGDTPAESLPLSRPPEGSSSPAARKKRSQPFSIDIAWSLYSFSYNCSRMEQLFCLWLILFLNRVIFLQHGINGILKAIPGSKTAVFQIQAHGAISVQVLSAGAPKLRVS